MCSSHWYLSTSQGCVVAVDTADNSGVGLTVDLLHCHVSVSWIKPCTNFSTGPSNKTTSGSNNTGNKLRAREGDQEQECFQTLMEGWHLRLTSCVLSDCWQRKQMLQIWEIPEIMQSLQLQICCPARANMHFATYCISFYLLFVCLY